METSEFRVLLRAATLACIAEAAMLQAALSAEYPGDTPAGRGDVQLDVQPFALLAWAHLGALDAAPGGRAATWWSAAAAAGDVALLAWTVGDARRGAPPIALALPVVAALLLAGVAGVAWSDRRGGRTRTP